MPNERFATNVRDRTVVVDTRAGCHKTMSMRLLLNGGVGGATGAMVDRGSHEDTYDIHDTDSPMLSSDITVQVKTKAKCT